MLQVNDIISYTNKSGFTIREIVVRLTGKSLFVKIIEKDGSIRKGSEHRRSLLSVKDWEVNKK